MKSRSTAVAVASVCAAVLLLPATAGAQEASQFNDIPVTGKVKPKGKKSRSFRGTYTVDRFVVRNGQPRAVGSLRGRYRGGKVRRSRVLMPVGFAPSQPGAAGAAACPILTLVLGPLDLNLLGLRVQLNRINLRITAVPGPGNLLGNLLCGVVGLLDQPAGNATQVTGLLNLLLSLLNNPSLGALNTPATAPAVLTR